MKTFFGRKYVANNAKSTNYYDILKRTSFFRERAIGRCGVVGEGAKKFPSGFLSAGAKLKNVNYSKIRRDSRRFGRICETPSIGG